MRLQCPTQRAWGSCSPSSLGCQVQFRAGRSARCGVPRLSLEAIPAAQQTLHSSRSTRLLCRASPPRTAVTPSLHEYICSGPLLEVCGFSPDQVAEQLDLWQKLGKRLAEQLGFDHDNLDESQKLRIYRYYLPIYFWVQQQLQQHKAKFPGTTPPPLVLGISAPQGCGKTTIVEQLQQLLSWLGHGVASVSIDDFYLRREDQQQLADDNPHNRLLQVRGNAGTHDLELGRSTLQQLLQLTTKESTAKVPRYDKSAFQGKGDRADEVSWPQVSGPLDLVLFEGWMLGFKPVGEQAAAAVEDSLVKVDEALQAYQEAWDSFVDAWLVVKIQDPEVVFGWRLQAEHAMRASGKPGMTDEQVAAFVSAYIPAYTAYLPGLYSSGPTTVKPGHSLVIEVDGSRAPVQQQPPPLLA